MRKPREHPDHPLQVGEALKSRIEGEFKKGGYRDIAQVMCNGGVGMIIACLFLLAMGWGRRERAMRLPKNPDSDDVRSINVDLRTRSFVDVTASKAKASARQRYLVGLQAAHMCLYASMNGDTWCVMPLRTCP